MKSFTKAAILLVAAWTSVPAHAQLSPSLQAIVDAGSGGVNYVYMMGTYEITNDEYVALLNAVADTDTYGLYDTSMNSNGHGGITRSGSPGSYTYSVKTDFGNKPVNFVRWLDAVRFINWLENGQPTGAQGNSTTESGVYTIGTNKATAYRSATRASGVRWFMPTLEEFKKAARYDPAIPGFWTYATQSNTTPTKATAYSNGDVSNPGSNVVTTPATVHLTFESHAAA